MAVMLAVPEEKEEPSGMDGAQTKERPTFRPVDLDRHPAVDTLLSGLGLGPFRRDSVTAPPGRNDSWIGTTESGREVVAKRMLGHTADVEARMDRVLSFERFIASHPGLAAHTPTFLGADRDAHLVVYEYVAGATAGTSLVIDDSFSDATAESVGRVVGLLHDTVPDAGLEIDRSLPAMPDTTLLHGLPAAMFNSLSHGELAAWRLMQQDRELTGALAAMRDREPTAGVPSHCDLRIDQLLLVGDHIYIIDWEEFRLADPARDVGAFAGEWLHRSVLDIVTNRGDTDDAFVDLELTHQQVLERGVAKMERLLPKFHAFLRGYRTVRAGLDGDFAVRVTAYAGWHLLDRLLAGASRSNRLSGIERAAAGVGRRAIISPAKFVPVLGLEEIQ